MALKSLREFLKFDAVSFLKASSFCLCAKLHGPTMIQEKKLALS